MKQEKNGLFAMLLAFCVMKVVGDYAEGELSLHEERFSVAAALSAGVVYFFLRALKRHTSVLDEHGR